MNAFDPPTPEEQCRMVEAILFAATAPMDTRALAEALPQGSDAAEAVRRVEALYAERGVHLVRVAGGWAFRTAPDLRDLLTRHAVEERRLSRAATEALAIIAYHQPCTRSEIEEIRGVSLSRGVLDPLLDAGWIRFGKRRETPGRPATLVTTDAFLDHFGLDSLRDLPGVEEMRAAGLFAATTGPGALFPGDAGAAMDDESEAAPGAPDLFDTPLGEPR